MTGLADTQIELTRDRPAWFPPGKSLQLPYPLLEVRHRIVHRHLPSLAELKRAAKDGLDWLWEWYWSQLDHAFPAASDHRPDTEPDALVREKLQGILKTYVKERKTEIKSRKKNGKAAETALSSYTLRYGDATAAFASTAQASRILLELLIDEQMILPADKKLGSSMSGAFLIWENLFLVFSPSILSVRTLQQRLIAAINTPTTSSMLVNSNMDPVKEGLYEWVTRLLCSETWSHTQTPLLLEDVFADLFSMPSDWNLKIAEAVLEQQHVSNEQVWRAILEAARKEGDDGDDMDVVEKDERVIEKEEIVVKEKIKGPTKVIGLWKARPLGWLPKGWENDE